jgi:hypothetical protein
MPAQEGQGPHPPEVPVTKTIKRTGPHQMTRKILHWSYCAHCGLVALRNDETRKALKARCEWIEDA